MFLRGIGLFGEISNNVASWSSRAVGQQAGISGFSGPLLLSWLIPPVPWPDLKANRESADMCVKTPLTGAITIAISRHCPALSCGVFRIMSADCQPTPRSGREEALFHSLLCSIFNGSYNAILNLVCSNVFGSLSASSNTI